MRTKQCLMGKMIILFTHVHGPELIAPDNNRDKDFRDFAACRG